MKATGEPRILVPIDFTDTSERAIDVAAGLAQKMGGSLFFIHVQDFHPEFHGIGTDWYYEDSLRNLEQQLGQLIVKHLGEAAKFSTSVLLRRSRLQVICDHARIVGADLIVMGTHGRRGIRGVMWGSVAGNVIHKAPCPVVTVGPVCDESRATA